MRIRSVLIVLLIIIACCFVKNDSQTINCALKEEDTPSLGQSKRVKSLDDDPLSLSLQLLLKWSDTDGKETICDRKR